jgi:hypothetical protein
MVFGLRGGGEAEEKRRRGEKRDVRLKQKADLIENCLIFSQLS